MSKPACAASASPRSAAKHPTCSPSPKHNAGHPKKCCGFSEAEIASRDESNCRNRMTAARFPIDKTLDEFRLSESSIPAASHDYGDSYRLTPPHHPKGGIGARTFIGHQRGQRLATTEDINLAIDNLRAQG